MTDEPQIVLSPALAKRVASFRTAVGEAVIGRHLNLTEMSDPALELALERDLLGLVLESVGEVGDYDGPPEDQPHPLSTLSPKGEAPVAVTIFCPECALPHVDEGEWATTRHHKTHQCQGCGHEWRPFSFATVGVAHPKGEAEAVAWRDIATEPRVQEIGHLWLAADAYGKVFPGVFVGHRIPRDAILVFRVPDPKAHPSAQPKADREAIARIIEPGAWNARDETERACPEYLGNYLPENNSSIRRSLAKADAILAALSAATPVQRGGEGLLSRLAEHTNYELSFVYETEEGDGAWMVHRVHGGRSDREWTVIGRGQTPAEALAQAIPTPAEQQDRNNG